MLRLSKKSEYGLIALKHLALHGEAGAASAKEIAERYSIPLPLLSKVLQKLVKGGVLESAAGSNGGYRLARAADRISTLEVIQALDGPVLVASCFNARGECEQSPGCSVREPLRRIHEAIQVLLDTITIAEISRPLHKYEDTYLPR